MNAIVSSADTATDPFAAQANPEGDTGSASSSAMGPGKQKNMFEVSGSVNLNARDANSGAHSNIVRAVYQGNSEGENKGEERYIVHVPSSSKSYAFKTEDEARAFLSYASATARRGEGATLGTSTSGKQKSLNLASWDLMSAAGGGGEVTGAFGQNLYSSKTSIEIENKRSTVIEVKPEAMEKIARFDYREFAGSGIPSLPQEATHYLQNVFKTVPTDANEFGLQMAALTASAQAVYKHNGYSNIASTTPITITDENVSNLIKAVFGADTVPNAGHLNTLRLLGLASAGEGGADNYATWKLSEKGVQIDARLDQPNSQVNYIASLSLAALKSYTQFALKGKLDAFINTDAATGTFSFATNIAENSGGVPFTFKNVQEHLQAQYALLNPEFQGVPPQPLPDGFLEASPEAKTMLESVFGTTYIDDAHVNTAIAAGLLTNTGSALTVSAQAAWLQTEAVAATAAPTP